MSDTYVIVVTDRSVAQVIHDLKTSGASFTTKAHLANFANADEDSEPIVPNVIPYKAKHEYVFDIISASENGVSSKAVLAAMPGLSTSAFYQYANRLKKENRIKAEGPINNRVYSIVRNDPQPV